MGLKGVRAASEEACARACCDLAGCELWQWAAAAPAKPLHSCWIGAQSGGCHDDSRGEGWKSRGVFIPPRYHCDAAAFECVGQRAGHGSVASCAAACEPPQGQQCTLQAHTDFTCSTPVVPTPVEPAGQCGETLDGVNLVYGAPKSTHAAANTTTPAACRALCAADRKCNFWTWHDNTTDRFRACYIRYDTVYDRHPEAGHFSGVCNHTLPPPATPPSPPPGCDVGVRHNVALAADCAALCQQDPACFSAVWDGAKQQTCWFRGKGAKAVRDNGKTGYVCVPPSAMGTHTTTDARFYVGGFTGGDGSNATQNAYLVYPATGDGPFPLVAWAHGCCQKQALLIASNYRSILVHMASHGVVVASFTSCLIQCGHHKFSADQLHLISALRGHPELHPVLSKVDFSRVGVMGHSMGAAATVTSAAAASVGRRGAEGIIAAVAIHGTPQNDDATAGLVRIPIFYTCGDKDHEVSCNGDVKKAFRETPALGGQNVFSEMRGASHLEIQQPLPGGRWDFHVVQFMLCHLNNDTAACADIYGTASHAMCSAGQMVECEYS